MPAAVDALQSLRSSHLSGTVLAFDYGKRRVGVAVGEIALSQAHPLLTFPTSSIDETIAAITPLIKTWQPVVLLLGLPLTDTGEAHQLAANCHQLMRRLKKQFQLPVCLVDERFSSAEATSLLKDVRQLSHSRTPVRPQDKKAIKPHTDAMAAYVLLEAWLSSSAPHAIPTNS